MIGLWNLPAQKPFMISYYLPTKHTYFGTTHRVLNNLPLVTFLLIFQHAYVYVTSQSKCTNTIPPSSLYSPTLIPLPSDSFSARNISLKSSFPQEAFANHGEKQSVSLKRLPCSCL